MLRILPLALLLPLAACTTPSTAPAPAATPTPNTPAVTTSVPAAPPRHSKVDDTQTTLQTLAAAAKEYKSQTGKEPDKDFGYFQNFKQNPQAVKILNRLPASVWGKNAILDAWGHPIKFIDGAHAYLPEGFFQSSGEDGIWNNTDDIRSVEPAH